MPVYDQCLAIGNVHELNSRQYVLFFESPEIAADCRPGQFVMISVDDSVDPLLRRPMAVYKVLRDDDGSPRGFALLIEVLGRGTAILQSQRCGQILKVLGPLGVPFNLPGQNQEADEQLLVMGGVGAAPFPFVAEELLRLGHAARAFVGARTADDLLCLEDFEELGVQVEIATDDGSSGHHGFVTGPLQGYLERHNPRPASLYACGPTAMMRAVDEIARAFELPLQVSLEATMACGIGVCLSCVIKVRSGDGWSYARCCREGPVFDSRDLVWE